MQRTQIDIAGLSAMQSALAALDTQLGKVRIQTGELVGQINAVPNAVRSLDTVFEQTGVQIARTLGQAAQSGKVDFQKMTEAILADLARLVTESVLARGRAAQAANQTVNLNMSLGAGSDADSVIGAAGSIATVLAGAVACGGRFL